MYSLTINVRSLLHAAACTIDFQIKLFGGFTDAENRRFIHSMKLYMNICMHDYRELFFTCRNADAWNNLPHAAKDCDSVHD